MLWSIREKMRPALAVIDLIPDVHRSQALAMLRKTVIDRGFGALRLTSEERDLAFYDGPQPITSPIGAQLLLALYKAGKIKLKKPPQKSLPTLEAYAATAAEFRAHVAQAEEIEAARRARETEILANPELAHADELTPALVARIFRATLGHGTPGRLTLGGIIWEKDLVLPPEDPEARMRPEPKERLRWQDQDGNLQEVWL